MKTSNPALTASEGHESWLPMLELAAKEVFELMLGSSLATSPEGIIEEKLDIASMVGLAGQVCGVVTVRCASKSATQMASKMLGLDPATAGPEMWDAMGEICNMVAGNFKNKITGMGDGCMLSVPTVITGADYSLHSLTDSGKIEISLMFEGSPVIFSLEVHS